MHDLSFDGSIHLPALDSQLRQALGNLLIGVSTGNGMVWVHMDDSTTPADDAVATSLANAHDPVFLSADKSTIRADGADIATVTIKAPKPGAAAVTLTINGTDYPVTLVNGVATEPITALDPTAISIAVKNPANRSTDILTIQAV